MSLQLNMSSILAYNALVSNRTNESALDYLKKNDPTYSHLDWKAAEVWCKILGENFNNSPLEIVCQEACLKFISSQKLLIELARNGRDALISNLNPDELQVFRNARLLERIPDNSIVKWWDNLKIQSRRELDELLLAQGRQAESWTIKEEMKYLRENNSFLAPEWVALDGDHYGYDILSYRLLKIDTPIPIQIEVKSFSKKNDPHFYLTAYEWGKALKVTPNYIFYIWCMETKEFKILTVEEVHSNIPSNNEKGNWQTVYITFKW